jgi:hypothetical protein
VSPSFILIYKNGLYRKLQEQAQLAAIRDQKKKSVEQKDRDFEGGFGGQEDLEDRYATTSGEH